MKGKENQVKKVCGFHVNDWHFTTMILPYVCNEIQNNNNIITILQNSIKPNIEEILSKMNLNKMLEKQIKEINWTKANSIKYSKIKQILQQINGQVQNVNILISGDKVFIDQVNQSIERIMQNINMEKSITIIDCYDMAQFENIGEIKRKYGFILNTSGIQKMYCQEQEKKNA